MPANSKWDLIRYLKG